MVPHELLVEAFCLGVGHLGFAVVGVFVELFLLLGHEDSVIAVAFPFCLDPCDSPQLLPTES